MKKLLGYIPLEPGEDWRELNKETDCVKIYDEWFKLAEVWVPGVAGPSATAKEFTNDAVLKATVKLYEKMTFQPKEGEEKHTGNKCVNCGRTRSYHKGIDGYCPPK